MGWGAVWSHTLPNLSSGGSGLALERERENVGVFFIRNILLWGYVEDPTLRLTIYMKFEQKTGIAIKAVSSYYPRRPESWGFFLAEELLKTFQNDLKMKCLSQSCFFKLEADKFKVYLEPGKYWNSSFVVYHRDTDKGVRSILLRI